MIPNEKLPEFFKDEIRRNVLYAPLRSKSVNPNDWNMKISSWSQLIDLYCSCNSVYSFSLESLKTAFHDNGRTPCCLDEVLQEMYRNGEIETYNAFLQGKPKSWKQWATNAFISTPIRWSFNKVKNLVLTPDSNMLYVPLKVLERDGDLLLNKILVNHKNKIMSLKEILEIENKDINKSNDFKILFTSLYNRGKVDIFELQNNNINDLDNFLIKFSDGHELKQILEVDLGIHTLEQNEKTLEKNIESLEDSITDCIKEAKIHLSKGHRQLAKASLRKKHEIENRIDKKVKALHNVQVLLHKLQDSKMDEGIWETYKKALNAFEETYKKGINEDAVEDTMLKVGEMLEIQSDVESSLSRPVVDVDADLEEELEQLLKNDDEHNDNNKGSPQKNTDDQLVDILEKLELNLPSVPSSPAANQSQNMTTELSVIK